ncbi:hypothetical protein HDV04_006050 [Boothiomyces sp. JEL0838]|nr:hypothetical protein HDV04_006050 [Boothiomyces sp. JEL0838]
MSEPTTLSEYWDLAAIDPEKRNNAALSLINKLAALHAEYTTEIKTVQDFQAQSAPDISYALKRLLRGLSSSRDGARQGFAVALTELLRLLKLPTVFILELLFEISEKNGTKTGQEEREFYFARLFGYQAIAQSGMLGSELTTEADIQTITGSIVKISKTKDYLRDVCAQIMITVLENCQASPLKKEFSQIILDSFLKDGIVDSDDVWFAVEASRIEGIPSFENLLSDWKKGNVLYPKNKAKLLDVLKNSTYHNTAILHPVFTSIISVISESSTTISLFEFWSAIEESFFNSSHERKFIGFQIFLEILSRVTTDKVPVLFTQNFLRCLINSLSSKETFLFKQARHTTSQLCEFASQNPAAALPLVMQLLGKHGHFKFDQITKTKTVETILSELTTEGIESFLEYLTKVFFDPTLLSSSTEGDVNNIRLWAVEQMYLFIRTGKIHKEEKWITYIVKFMITHGFFVVLKSEKDEIIKKVEPELSPACQASIREKVLSSLAYLKTISFKTDGSSAQPGHLANGNTWVFTILEIVEKMKKNKNLKLAVPLEEEAKNAVEAAWTSIQNISSQMKVKDDVKNELAGFKLLLTHTALNIHHIQDESVDLVKEIQDCYNLMYPQSVKGQNKKRKQEDTEEELAPVEVLTDILISFLAKSSAVQRGLASDVFKIFAGKATEKVVELFFDVLTAKAGVQGAEELFEDEDEMLEDEMLEDEEGDESEESEEEDAELEDDDDQEPVDEELKKKIQEALEMENDVEMEDLDDEGMAAFDSKLAEIFSQRREMKNVKKGNFRFNSESKENVLHFKLRVLDLMDIFFKANIQRPIVLTAIPPLIKLYLETSGSEENKVLHNKIGTLLQTRLSNSKELPEISDCTLALEILADVHKLSAKVADLKAASVYSGIAIFVTKTITRASAKEETAPAKSKKQKTETKKSNVRKAAEIYEHSFTQFMTAKNSKIRHVLFADLAQRCNSMAWEILPHMIESTLQKNKPISFSLVKAYEIIVATFKNLNSELEVSLKSDIAKLLSKLSQGVVEVIEKAPTVNEGGVYGLPKDRIKATLKSFAAVVRRFKKLYEPAEYAKIFDSEKLKSSIQKFADHERYQKVASLKGLTAQILQLF